MSRRVFVANHATGHVCVGNPCPACNPDAQTEAPLAPSRGVLGNSHRADGGNVIRLHAADDEPLLPPRYITK